MAAVLKEIKFLESLVVENVSHPILMRFCDDNNVNDFYDYKTSLENQYCSVEERKKGLLKKDVSDKLRLANSQIGMKFDINLYKFSVSEITNGKFQSLEFMDEVDGFHIPENDDCDDDYIVSELRRATYKTREDRLEILKLQVCLMGLNSTYVGVKSDGTIEDIDETLIFNPQQFQPKQFHITIDYNRFPEVNEQFILFSMPVDNIEKGTYLALRLKEYKIKDYDVSYLIIKLKDYRKYAKEVDLVNSSFIKRIRFWEPKEELSEFEPTKNSTIQCSREMCLQFFKDSYILSKQCPTECVEAKKEYSRKCEENLRKKYLGDNNWEKKVREKLIETLKTQSFKYKGKIKIRLLQ